MTICSFTGHRANKPCMGGYIVPNPIYIKICQLTKQILLELKPEKCISGMALTYDQYAANLCINMKIPFIAAIPFIGQESQWPKDSQIIYNKILDKAVEKVIVSPGGYTAAKMQIRNQYMVDNSDVLIALWDGSKGGTGNCVEYAESIGRKIVRINPLTWEITGL